MTTEPDDTGARLLNAAREAMAEFGAADETRIEPFTLKGVTFHIRTFTAERWLALKAWRDQNRDDAAGLVARFIAAAVVTADGTPLLTAGTAGQLPEAVALAIFNETLRRNRLL